MHCGPGLKEWCAGHVPFYGFIEVIGAACHHVPQVAQGENPQRGLIAIDHHNAADLLFMHQGHGFAQWRDRAAGHRMTHGQLAQASIERVLGAQGFHGFLLDLLVDLIQQAADATQGEIAKGVGKREQFDERQLVQLQAEGVFSRQVLGTSGPLTPATLRGESTRRW